MSEIKSQSHLKILEKIQKYIHRWTIQRKIVSILLCAVILTLSIVVINTFNNKDDNYKVDEKISDSDFCKMTHQLFCQEVSGSTISLHYTLENPQKYNLEEVTPTFGHISTDVNANGIALENALAAVNAFDQAKLSKENSLTRDVLKYYLETAKEGLPYILYQEPLSPVNGAQSQIPVLLTEFRIGSRADVEVYLQLLNALPVYFQEAVEVEKEKAKAGLFMSDDIADEVISQCQAFLDMGNANYLISTFVNRVKTLKDIDGDTLDIYIEENAKAVTETLPRAYKKLKREVELLKGQGKNAQGLCYFPEGRDYYSYLVKRQTGSSRSVEEMEMMTRQQILTDLSAMERELGISGDAAPAAAVISAEKMVEESSNISYNNALSMLEDLKAKCTSAFPISSDTTAQIKYVPTAMESVLSPAFYMIPPIDNISENVIYVNRSQVRGDLGLYTTLAHEGYPGHLYQNTYFAKQNPDEIRYLLDFGGYTEGWATYAEMMSYYMAPITDRQAVLAQKNASILLGVYALADMGIHHDGWSRENAAAFFRTYGITDAEVVNRIYNLILGDPGNYLKYYIGYLEILELKKEMMENEGDGFSQKEFHEKLLQTGPAPFSIIHTQMVGQGDRYPVPKLAGRGTCPPVPPLHFARDSDILDKRNRYKVSRLRLRRISCQIRIGTSLGSRFAERCRMRLILRIIIN